MDRQEHHYEDSDDDQRVKLTALKFGIRPRHLRWVFITPDMHRVHHSLDTAEHNGNYGGLFSFWDRLFGNYVDAPALGHSNMVIGQPGFTGPEHNRIDKMLLNPFLSPEPGDTARADGRAAAAALD